MHGFVNEEDNGLTGGELCFKLDIILKQYHAEEERKVSALTGDYK